MVAVCIAACALPGCYSKREGLEPEATGPGACAGTCHGDGTGPAPPFDLDGNTETHFPGVGAHQVHLNKSLSHPGLDCRICHVVPEATGDPGHADDARPADLRFALLAVTGGRSPSYDPRTRTCANTYCHSGPPTALTPWPADAVWIYPRDSEAACGTSCHATPPADPTSTTVGAHRRHLDANEMAIAAPFGCNVCHELPPTSQTHLDGTTDLVFSGLATGTVDDAPIRHQSTPSYAPATRQCSDVYCHGGWAEATNPSGGSATEPVWDRVDGSQVSCGGCHGFPPPAPHPASASCQDCHPAVVNEQLDFVDLTKHVNGQVDFN